MSIICALSWGSDQTSQMKFSNSWLHQLPKVGSGEGHQKSIFSLSELSSDNTGKKQEGKSLSLLLYFGSRQVLLRCPPRVPWLFPILIVPPGPLPRSVSQHSTQVLRLVSVHTLYQNVPSLCPNPSESDRDTEPS